MSVGKRISKKRKDLNLTQEELAFRINVSRQSISKWELDEYLPDMYNIIELSKVLGISVDYIISGNEQVTSMQKLDLKDYIVLITGFIIMLLTIILLIFKPEELFETGSILYINGFNILITLAVIIISIGFILIYKKNRK